MIQRNALREALENMTRKCITSRSAAVRRSLRTDWLYATDLPELLSEMELAVWIKSAEKQGWNIVRDGGWLLLNHDIPDSFSGRYEGPFGEEAACCASLLKRRGGSLDASDAKRRLIKAGEQGRDAYELVCRELHEEWAEALRKGKELPALPLDWLEKTLDKPRTVEYDNFNFIQTVEEE